LKRGKEAVGARRLVEKKKKTIKKRGVLKQAVSV